MKKILILLTLIGSLYAELTVIKTQNFTQSELPTLLRANFSLSKISNEVSQIEKEFAKNSDFIAKYKICKGGSYSINPRYKWDKNEKIFIGYEGYISYECGFKEVKEFDEITNNISQKDQKITLGAINWILTPTQITTLEQKIEEDILNFSSTYGTFLSKNLDKSCEAKKIEFLDTHTPYSPKTLMASREASPPTQDLKDITKTARFEFLCK